ncbi:hypothetical protein AZF37_08415 [endosymbiont 'TC1' of Trimyema compressum]|uniref:hypothetical protein n=1 Tax=endosymbiont 'TC1' of Trimyema compressum TaxID=243899 RepID=UPI0007F0B967|nr:hypothetical protein [endosymbiont 'TC1' of Trimyema compressum]AMP21178.1 hypothetical protein AZF37_08415 [endosymbiont 'TC1' of Trimyema compressum]
MIEIGFYLGENLYLVAIGESFLIENIDGVRFSLVENELFFKRTFLVVLKSDKEGLNFEKII